MIRFQNDSRSFQRVKINNREVLCSLKTRKCLDDFGWGVDVLTVQRVQGQVPPQADLPRDEYRWSSPLPQEQRPDEASY